MARPLLFSVVLFTILAVSVDGRRPLYSGYSGYGVGTYGGYNGYNSYSYVNNAATRSASTRAATASVASTTSAATTANSGFTFDQTAITTAVSAYVSTTAAATGDVTTTSVASTTTAEDATTASVSTTTAAHSAATTAAAAAAVHDSTAGYSYSGGYGGAAHVAALRAATTRVATTTRATTASHAITTGLTTTSLTGKLSLTSFTGIENINDIAAILSTRNVASANLLATTNAALTTTNAATTHAATTTNAAASSGAAAGGGSSSGGVLPPAGGDDYSILYFGPTTGKSVFFLQTLTSNISLVVKVTPTSRIYRVEIWYNGVRIGYCSGRPPTFVMSNVPIYDYHPSDVLEAVPLDRTNMQYTSVTYSPQFIRIPAWLASKARPVGNNTLWSLSLLNTRITIAPSSFDASSLSVIGFRASYSGYLLSNISVTSGGVCLLTSGEGFLTISLVSASSGVSSTATIPINVQATFGLVQTADKFFEPTLAGLTMSIAGTYPGSTSWAFDWAISIGPLVFGVEAAMTPVSTPDVFLPYKADLNSTGLGLPLSLMRGSRVNLPIALQISAALDVGADIDLISSGNIVPTAAWQNQAFSFTSADVDCELALSMDVWIQNFKVDLIDIDTTLTFPGKRRSARSTIPISVPTNGTLIRNRWAPATIVAPGVFRVVNVYPSSSLQLASTGEQDMAVWQSFLPNPLSPYVAMQIQFTYRNRGGSWVRQLGFLPGPADQPMVQPELAQFGDTFIVVAIVLTNPRADSITDQFPQLVYSIWDKDDKKWGDVKRLFGKNDKRDDPHTSSYDFLPALSRNGQFLAFRRVQADGSQALLAVSADDFNDDRPPGVVIADASAIRDVSIDSDDSKTVMIAYQLRGSSTLQLCYFNSGWRCNQTAGTVGSFSRPVVVYDRQNNYCVAWADPNNIVRTQYYAAATGTATTAAALRLTYTPWDMAAMLTSISGSGIVISWQAPLPGGVYFDYALASPGRILYSSQSRVPLSEEISGKPGAPISLSTVFTGNTILFTSMLRTQLRRSSEGQFTLHELPVSADLAVVSVTYDPPDFSRNDINVTATLQNLGLEPFIAPINGEITMFVYDPISKSLTEITHAPQPSSLDSGETYQVSFMWHPAVDSPTGGIVLMDATTPTPDVNATNNVLATDPCLLVASRIKVITTGGQSVITIRLQVLGWLSGRVKLEAYSRPANSPNTSTSFIGSSGLLVTPGWAGTVRIPVFNPALLASYIRVEARGPSDSFASVTSILPDLRYDFSFDEFNIVINAQADGAVVVTLPVLNKGSAVARGVLVEAYLGTTERPLLASARIDLGPYDNQSVSLSFQLTYALSAVLFIVNGDTKFPETFSFDNTIARTIYIPSLPNGGTIATGPAGTGGAAGDNTVADSSASSSGLPPAFAAAGPRKTSASATTSSPDSSGDSLGTPAIVGISIGVIVAVATISVIGFFIWKQSTATPYTQMEEH